MQRWFCADLLHIWINASVVAGTADGPVAADFDCAALPGLGSLGVIGDL